MSDLPQYFLQRQPSTPDGTFGEWLNPDKSHLCYTVELPWADNEPQKSCIPAGTYVFNAYNSPEHGAVWMAQDVPCRSNIEVHNANFAYQLLGCLGCGDEIDQIGGVPAVLHSVATLDMLRGVLPASFQLTITDYQPTV